MLHTDPSSWGPLVWALHGLGLAYLVGFFAAWARFRRVERLIRGSSEGALERFNADLQRFPWSFYAKMLGRHRYEDDAPVAGDDVP